MQHDAFVASHSLTEAILLNKMITCSYLYFTIFNEIIMQYFKQLKEYETKEIFPGYLGRFEHTNNMTLAFWNVKAGSSVPEHSHIHEQIVTVREGRFELTVNGESKILDEGMIAVIPSNIKHSGIAITDCKLLDIFYPVREDYKDCEK